MDEERMLLEVEARVGLDHDHAYRMMMAVLQELHDRLTPKEADDLAAQLPGEFKEKWHTFDVPGRKVTDTHCEDFTRHLAQAADVDEMRAKKGLMAAFKAFHILLNSPTGQEGEAWHVYSQLPKDLKRMWIAAASMPPIKAKPAQAGMH